MEDQDFWRLSGIERDVFLQAYPKLTIWDFFLKPDLDVKYKNGLFSGTVDIRAFEGNGIDKGKFTLELFDNDGKKVLSCSKPFSVKGKSTVLSFGIHICMIAQ